MSVPRMLTDTMTVTRTGGGRDAAGGPTRTDDLGNTPDPLYEDVPCKAFPANSQTQLTFLQMQLNTAWTVFSTQGSIGAGDVLTITSTGVVLRVVGRKAWPTTGGISAFYEYTAEEQGD